MPTGKPIHGARIHWKDHERELLLQAAVKLLRDKQAVTGQELIAKAQIAALPAGRRRPTAGLSGSALLNEARRALAAQDGGKAPANGISPPPNFLEAEPPRRRATDLNPPAPPPTPVEAFAELPGNALAQILVQALTHPDTVAAVRELAAPTPAERSAQVHYPFGIDALRGSKHPKVLIAGTKGNQAEALKPLTAKLGLNVEFWSKDESSESLRRLARNSDTAIGMVSFLAHSHDAILKHGAPKYLRVTGGVSAIAEKLRKEFPAPARVSA